MEMEIGVVGGEEDGVDNGENEKLYTTPRTRCATAEELGLGENGRYLLAATFGNVHGVYKPGNVKLQARRSSRRSRTRSARSSARSARSTWSSTAAPARCSRRSARRSTTAS